MSPAEQEPNYDTDDALVDAFDGFDEWLDKLRHGGKVVDASIPAENGVLLAAINSTSPLSKSITVAISPEMRAVLEEIAYDGDCISIGRIVRVAILDYLVGLIRERLPAPHDELGRLRGMIQYCIEGPDDPGALKMVLQDALKRGD